MHFLTKDFERESRLNETIETLYENLIEYETAAENLNATLDGIEYAPELLDSRTIIIPHTNRPVEIFTLPESTEIVKLPVPRSDFVFYQGEVFQPNEMKFVRIVCNRRLKLNDFLFYENILFDHFIKNGEIYVKFQNPNNRTVFVNQTMSLRFALVAGLLHSSYYDEKEYVALIKEGKNLNFEMNDVNSLVDFRIVDESVYTGFDQYSDSEEEFNNDDYE